MSLKISNEFFTGPFDLDKFTVRSNQKPAVYAIVSREGLPWDPTYRLIDIGETGEAGINFKDHPKREEWRSLGGEQVAVYFINNRDGQAFDGATRREIVERIKHEYAPPKGIIAIQAGA